MGLEPGDLHLLARVPLLAGLGEEDLAWIAGGATAVPLAPGEVLAAEGEAGDALFVVAAGELEVVKRSRASEVPIARLGPGEIVGEIAVLEGSARIATIRAAGPSRVVRIGRDAVLELVRTRPDAALAMLRTVTGRLRSTEGLLREREKLAALGTLAAGLAHELNNPAAAVQRSAGRLHEALDRWSAATDALAPLVAGAERAGVVARLGRELPHGGGSLDEDPLAAGDRAAELEDLLGGAVDDPAALAADLAAAGWTADALAPAAAAFGAEDLGSVARWAAAAAEVHALVDEVGTGARRISEIVAAVKDYAYMDRAPVVRVDVAAGLESTLVILRPKLKAGIEVEREIEAGLPTIDGYGSELNQVWTNLVDNAIDALGGRGHLRIRAARRGDELVVEVCDDGPGIPPDVRERIFEPFYTTKPPGSGTGLGLHISHNVVARHGGRIEVRSRPGETCFEVALPIDRRAG